MIKSKNTTGPAVYKTMRSKAKALLDDTSVSTRAVYQPRSTKRKHICQSGISTVISNAQASLAQPYINSDQRSESASGTAGPMMGVSVQQHNQSAKRKRNWHSRITTTSRKAKAPPNDTAESTSGIYQPRSAKRKHIWHSCISTAISTANPPPRHSARFK